MFRDNSKSFLIGSRHSVMCHEIVSNRIYGESIHMITVAREMAEV